MIQNYLKKLGLLGLVAGGAFLTPTEASAQTACSDLFFSEYIEGSSFNKSIEIYNPTNTTINLSNYKVTLHSAAVVAPNQSLTLTGTLLPGQVYVISHAQANAAILAQTDLSNSTLINFNGDDAVLLWKIVAGNDVLIDKIGENTGTAPAAGAWTVGTGSTKDYTLVRKATVTGGQTNWAVGATEWDVFPNNTDTQIGSHTSNCATPPAGTTVGFASGTATVAENVTGGTATVSVNITNPSATAATTVNVGLATTGTATAGTDFTFTGSTLTWAAGDNAAKTVTINITDDAILEQDETVILTLTNPSTGATLGTSTFTLTIDDNEIRPIPTYTVAQISNNNVTTGQPDSLGVKVKLIGTIYGVNQRTTGLQLTLIDATGGVGLFTTSAAVVPTVAPIEGDRVRAIGTVAHFNGLTQLTLDSIVVLANNQTLVTPTLVTGPLTEAHESELIKIANPVTLVTPSQWPTTSVAADVDVTDGTNTYKLRAVPSANLHTIPAPTGPFMLTGIGGQFDQTDPRDSGYQILPRRLADIQTISGASEDLANAISIYPNPASQTLKLKGLESKKATVSIINALGQVVANVPANASEINVSSFPAGVYTLRIAASDALVTKRFVKIN